MLYTSQHVQRIINEFTYSRNAEGLEVYLQRKNSFHPTVKVTFNYAKCGAGLVHYMRIHVEFLIKIASIHVCTNNAGQNGFN